MSDANTEREFNDEDYEAILTKAFAYGYDEDAITDALVGDLYSWTGDGFGIQGVGEPQMLLVTTEQKVGFLDYVMREYELSDGEIESAVENALAGSDDLSELYDNPATGLVHHLLGGVIETLAERKRE